MNFWKWILVIYLISTAFLLVYNSGFVVWIFYNIFRNGNIMLYAYNHEAWEFGGSIAIFVTGLFFFGFIVGYIYEKTKWI